MPSPGRPPIAADKRLSDAVPVRFTKAERAIIEWAAEQSGATLSGWIRTEAVAAAKRQRRRQRRSTTDSA